MMQACPHCGKEILIDLESHKNSEIAGRDFAIVYLSHRGVKFTEIAKAFGVTPTTIQVKYHKLFKKYGPSCGFYYAKRTKNDQLVLCGFYKNGKWFFVRTDYPDDVEWRDRKKFESIFAQAEDGERIENLSEWTEKGFVVGG